MQKLIGILLALGIGAGATESGAQMVTKDGRQYLLDLKRRLEIDDADLDRAFLDLRQNLPKQNTVSSMASSLDAIAKLAATACTLSGYFQEAWPDVETLYKTFLDRAPSAKEKASALRDSGGRLVHFTNCFMLALHPEFLKRK